MLNRYAQAARALREARQTGSSICQPIQDAFDVDDVGVATFGDPFGARMICASGPSASAFGERQIDLGEGPSWKALHTGRPVLVLDVTINALWPELARDLRGMPVRSVFAFPLSVGMLSVGAMSLSTAEPRVLEEPEVEAASTLASLAAAAVLERATRAEGADTDADDDTFSLREVHQATGMVVAQLGSSPADALLAIRAHSFSTGRSVREISRDIVARQIDLSRD